MTHENHFVFSSAVKELIFEPIKIDSTGGVLAACIVLTMVAIGYEGIRLVRKYLIFRSIEEDRRRTPSDVVGERMPLQNGTVEECINCSSDNWMQSLLHMVQMFIGYILMLSVMTYNAWLLLAVLLGAAAGAHLLNGHHWSSKRTAQFEVRLSGNSSSTPSSTASNIQTIHQTIGSNSGSL